MAANYGTDCDRQWIQWSAKIIAAFISSDSPPSTNEIVSSGQG